MQLIPSIPDTSEDEPPDTVSLTVVPAASAPRPPSDPAANADEALDSDHSPEQTPVMAMFTALSACSNLHPDPIGPEDEEDGSRLMQAGLAIPGMSDGSLPPPMPGSGGWITAENMHEFIDEDGNWINTLEEDDEEEEELADDQAELGPGAGSVRPRPPESGTNGHSDDDETKWRRTS